MINRKKTYLYVKIPYADITVTQINNSVAKDKDKMPRAIRSEDTVEVKFKESNKSHYAKYATYNKSDIYSPDFDKTYNSISLKSSDLDISTDIGLEIGSIDITTVGGSYSAGALTATGGGGGGFKGTYTVSSGAIDTVTILNRGNLVVI